MMEANASQSDQRLFFSLLGEIGCLQEMLEAIESESVSVEDAVGMVGGIQRDIVQLYRAAQG